MRKNFKSVLIAALLLAVQAVTNASFADDVHVNASHVKWTAPPASYLGSQFAKAFRYRTLVGGPSAPVRGKNVYFGEAEWAPGAIYVGHKHPAPEIYYVISGEAEWTIDGKTFRATAGTAVYTKPNAVHRMVNVGDGVLRTVWMWWGEPKVLNQFPEVTEPAEQQPAGARFDD